MTIHERRKFDSKIREARGTYRTLRQTMASGPLGSADAPVVMNRIARKQFESIIAPRGSKSDSTKLTLEVFFYAWLKVKNKGEQPN